MKKQTKAKLLFIFLIGFLVVIGFVFPSLPSLRLTYCNGVFVNAEIVNVGFSLETQQLVLPSVPVPASAMLSVPFYTHDAKYLYLNPGGLCRFATKEMILAYWSQNGYPMAIPDQYTLFVEEKHAVYNDTKYVESYTSRGMLVVTHYLWTVGLGGYANNYEQRFDGDADVGILYAKIYLSNGVPLDGAVAVNDEGWPDPQGWPLPNHAIVYTGYNETGFFFNNPISLNLTKPSCGSNKFMTYETFREGVNEHFWWYDAIFPKTYERMKTTVDVTAQGSQVFTIFGSYPLINGQATIPTLKTGSIFTVDDRFPVDNCMMFGFIDEQLRLFYASPVPLQTHPPEPIPTPPTTPPETPPEQPPESPPNEPKYPYEPIPQNPPSASTYSIPLLLLLSILLSFCGLLFFLR